jgi:hypothetical protein
MIFIRGLYDTIPFLASIIKSASFSFVDDAISSAFCQCSMSPNVASIDDFFWMDFKISSSGALA